MTTIGQYKTRQEKRRQAAANCIVYNPEWRPDYNKSANYRWVENASDGLRFVGEAHKIRGSGNGNLPYFDRALVDHTGWFIDHFQDQTVCGVVYQLPASRKGESRYLPGVSDAYNDDCAVIDFHSVTDDLTDAIRWADSMAEHYAEAEREYQEKQAREDRAEEIAEEIKTEFADFKLLCREIRANCDKVTGLVEVRKLIHREYRRVRSNVRKLRRELAEVTP